MTPCPPDASPAPLLLFSPLLLSLSPLLSPYLLLSSVLFSFISPPLSFLLFSWFPFLLPVSVEVGPCQCGGSFCKLYSKGYFCIHTFLLLLPFISLSHHITRSLLLSPTPSLVPFFSLSPFIYLSFSLSVVHVPSLFAFYRACLCLDKMRRCVCVRGCVCVHVCVCV